MQYIIYNYHKILNKIKGKKEDDNNSTVFSKITQRNLCPLLVFIVLRIFSSIFGKI